MNDAPSGTDELAAFVTRLSAEPEADTILQQLDDASVVALLLFVEARLGSIHERPGDLDLCQILAHRWNNLRSDRILQRACARKRSARLRTIPPRLRAVRKALPPDLTKKP